MDVGVPGNINSVSSDEVIESYRRQLSDAHHTIAVLTAQLAKAALIMAERERTMRVIREEQA